jgi:hypothetical protein
MIVKKTNDASNQKNGYNYASSSVRCTIGQMKHVKGVGLCKCTNFYLQSVDVQTSFQVYIFEQMAPGAMYTDDLDFVMRPTFNDKLVEIFKEYNDIIVAVISGHHHYDSFHIIGETCKKIS